MTDQRILHAIRHLSESVGTPFYLLDLDGVRDLFRRQDAAWSRWFPTFRAAYPYKTNPLRPVTRFLRDLGAAAEVASGVELQWAVDDGFDPDRIFFNGPAKTDHEIASAQAIGVNIQVDSLDELDRILRLAHPGSRSDTLAIRLACNTSPAGWSHFGLLHSEYERAVARLRENGEDFCGIHFHQGSNVPTPHSWISALCTHLPVLRDVLRRHGPPVRLNVGGGFPARSAAHDTPPATPEDFAAAIATVLQLGEVPLDQLDLVIEAGRSLVEDCGYLVTGVVSRKRRPDGNLIMVDAGSHLARPRQHRFRPIECLSAAPGDMNARYTIYGPHCFEADMLATDVQGPNEVAIGDLIVIGAVGAYDLSSAGAWSRPNPPIFGLTAGSVSQIPRSHRLSTIGLAE